MGEVAMSVATTAPLPRVLRSRGGGLAACLAADAATVVAAGTTTGVTAGVAAGVADSVAAGLAPRPAVTATSCGLAARTASSSMPSASMAPCRSGTFSRSSGRLPRAPRAARMDGCSAWANSAMPSASAW
eukprot:scaffold33944_cov60-Phaeocystis_antarctica.AAC.1